MRKYNFIQNIDINNSIVEAELNKHDKWVSNTKIQGTPTILVNGYSLPANYLIEDLIFQ